MPARIAAIHPAKYLLLLGRRQTARPPVAGVDRSASSPSLAALSHLHMVVRFNPYDAIIHIRRRFAFAHPLDGHQPDRFQRLVIESSSVSFQGRFDQPLPNKFLFVDLLCDGSVRCWPGLETVIAFQHHQYVSERFFVWRHTPAMPKHRILASVVCRYSQTHIAVEHR